MASPYDFMGSVLGSQPGDSQFDVPVVGPNPLQQRMQQINDAMGLVHAVDDAFPSEQPPDPTQPKKTPWQAMVLGGLQDALTALSIKQAQPQVHYQTVKRNGRHIQVPVVSQAWGPIGRFGGLATAMSAPVVDAAQQDKMNLYQWQRHVSRNEQLKEAVSNRILAEALTPPKPDEHTQRFNDLKTAVADGTVTRQEYQQALHDWLVKRDDSKAVTLADKVKQAQEAGAVIAAETPEQKANRETYEKSQKPPKAAAGITPYQQQEISDRQTQRQIADLDRQESSTQHQIDDLQRQRDKAEVAMNTEFDLGAKRRYKNKMQALDKQLNDPATGLNKRLSDIQQNRSMLAGSGGKQTAVTALPSAEPTSPSGYASADDLAKAIPGDPVVQGHKLSEWLSQKWPGMTQAQRDQLRIAAMKASGQ